MSPGSSRIRPVAEEIERDDRLLHARLDEQEDRDENRRENQQPADLRTRPAGALTVREAYQERDHRRHEDERAGPVQVEGVLRALQAGQDAADHNERDQPDRQVDVEDPVPADGVRDDATEGRPHERGQPEHRAEETLVLAALGRR